jgi:hypothetical protein
MRQTKSSRARGSVAEILFVLLLVLFFVCLFIRPHPGPDFARKVKQKAQLHSLFAGLELFRNEFGSYPPSDANDAAGVPYCGAMKLAEAITGQDLLGVHVNSVFRADGQDGRGVLLYPSDPSKENMQERQGPFIQADSANAYRLVDIYGQGNTGPFPEDAFVCCDVYERERPGGRKIAMPILYYRADTASTGHDPNDPENPDNIYGYRDNHALVVLGVPGDPNAVHPLADSRRFYMNTRDERVATKSQPYHADKFILLSAGRDGLYGTSDDVFNFQWKYRE